MRRPGVRWSVLVVAVAAAAGCIYWAATLERAALIRRQALAAAAADGRALQASLADARRALSAMASPGQAAVSWSRQATASIAAARERLVAVAGAGAPAGSDSGAALAKLGERFDRLVEAERRVRENAVGGRGLMASDLAFGEALPHVDAIDSAVAEAVAAMTLTADRAVAATRDEQLVAIAGAIGALGLAALVLTPTGARRETTLASPPSDSVETPAVPDALSEANLAGARAESADAGLALGLSLRPGVDDVPETPAAPSRSPWSSAPVPVPPAAPAPASDLVPLATACDALAGLADADALPAALDTARRALDARGVVVWLASADRTALSVVASAGYDRRIVERFPSTHVNDSNPTSRAFASGTPSSTLPGPGQPAALAVPIGGARGRIGVLSAELVDGAVADAQVIARARIVAAQLATLLEPAATPTDQPAGDLPAAEHA